MKKLISCIISCLMMTVCACRNSEHIGAEKQKVSEILTPYKGSVVMGKTKTITDNRSICTLQLARTVDGTRYIYRVDGLPGWVWREYDIDDTIHIETPQAQELGD